MQGNVSLSLAVFPESARVVIEAAHEDLGVPRGGPGRPPLHEAGQWWFLFIAEGLGGEDVEADQLG